MHKVTAFVEQNIHNIWILGTLAGIVSSVLDNFATSLSFISIYPVVDFTRYMNDYMLQFVQNGDYWKVIAYCSAMGGNVMAIGSVSGLALMKMERMHLGWYLRHVGWYAMAGGLLGLLALWIVVNV